MWPMLCRVVFFGLGLKINSGITGEGRGGLECLVLLGVALAIEVGHIVRLSCVLG
jgi:hypothetical protein